MVPPEEIETNKPTTLPADFSEWDSGESESPAEQPARFNEFEAVPRSTVVSRPQVKPATARVAVAAVEERTPKAVPRPAPAPAPKTYERAEKIAPPPAPRSVEPDSYEEEGESKGKGKMLAIGGAVLLLVVAVPLGYFKLRSSKAPTPQPTISQTTVTNVPMTENGTNTPAMAKPSAASPTSANSSTAATDNTGTTAADNTQTTAPLRTQMMNHQLSAPSRIPDDLKMMAGREAPPSSGFGAPGMDGMGNATNVFGGESGPKVKSAPPSKVSISAGIAGGLLLKRSAPVYPQIAKEARVSGSVVIQATISRTGQVENARVVNGPTMLRQAALDAVKTWRYRPYLLDGQPVEVETTVNVVFSLAD